MVFTLSLDQAAQWMDLNSSAQGICKGVAVDTRLLKKGQLFFALPGGKVDGHAFLKEAAFKGASGAVVHEDYQGEVFGLPRLLSKDPLASLQKLAKKRLSHYSGTVIGITGSLGKTTVKEFAWILIKEAFCTSKSPGNANSQIGLPLSLLNHLDQESQVLIGEMGMTAPGQIQNLTTILPPDIALVTTVAPVHIGSLGSLDAIAQAKAEIFSHPKTSLGIYPLGIKGEHYFQKTGKFLKQTYSMHDQKADFFLSSSMDGMVLKTRQYGTLFLPPLPIPGVHNQYNFLAAAALSLSFGLPLEALTKGVQALKLPERRLERVEKQGVIFINDSYNASELSVQAALKTLPEPNKGKKKIAVLGEMLDLGPFSKKTHEEVAKTALSLVDEMWCLGKGCLPMVDVWKKEEKPVFFFLERKDLVSMLREHVMEGDVVLLKGSLANEMWKVIEEIGSC